MRLSYSGIRDFMECPACNGLAWYTDPEADLQTPFSLCSIPTDHYIPPGSSDGEVFMNTWSFDLGPYTTRFYLDGVQNFIGTTDMSFRSCSWDI